MRATPRRGDVRTCSSRLEPGASSPPENRCATAGLSHSANGLQRHPLLLEEITRHRAPPPNPGRKQSKACARHAGVLILPVRLPCNTHTSGGDPSEHPFRWDRRDDQPVRSRRNFKPFRVAQGPDISGQHLRSARFRIGGASAYSLIAFASPILPPESCPVFDLILRNGTVIDGTKAPARRADVGVTGDRIVAVGDLAAASARQTIDAAGRVVAPGFVDVHNHSDGWLVRKPHLAPKTLQGFTTEVLMADGISYAPCGARMPTNGSSTCVRSTPCGSTSTSAGSRSTIISTCSTAMSLKTSACTFRTRTSA